MKRKALLIGINDYHLLGELKYARQDAESFAEALKTHYDFADLDITLMFSAITLKDIGLSWVGRTSHVRQRMTCFKF